MVSLLLYYYRTGQDILAIPIQPHLRMLYGPLEECIDLLSQTIYTHSVNSVNSKKQATAVVENQTRLT